MDAALKKAVAARAIAVGIAQAALWLVPYSTLMIVGPQIPEVVFTHP
jgi:hypothetical protein